MTSEKSQIITVFDSKETAKWRPLQLANKLNGYISEGKISNNDIFVRYIEIVPIDIKTIINEIKPCFIRL